MTRQRRHQWRRRALLFERLEPRAMLAARPIITEFLASNDATLQDGFGRDSDWIEIHNAGDAPVDLAGYHLSDDSSVVDKWTFPSSLVLAADQYLIVFASEEDRTDPLGYSHTNFKLNADGDYLALVSPDLSVLSEYGTPVADYPPQLTDISYGISGENSTDVGYLLTPTPGEANSGTVLLGPVIDRVDFAPGEPMADEPIAVTAKVVASIAPVDASSIRLHYRVMYGNEVQLAMHDNGMGVDAIGGDGIFTAQIPAGAFSAGEMVRWYVTAQDTDGRMSRAPRFHDALDSAQYFGTVAIDPSITTGLPVMHWFVEDPAAAQKEAGTRGSLYFLGEFYDNIHIDLHGRSTTAPTFPKKSFNFDANTGQKFRLDAAFDRASDFNLLTNYADKTYLRNALAYEVFERSGSASHFAFSVVVHRNGSYYGLYDLVEDGDEEFLARVGLDPDGALYKVNNGFDSATASVEKKSREYEDHSDLEQLVDSESLNTLEGKIWVYDHLNIASWVNYFAVQSLIANRDYGQKNYYLYNDSNGTRLWTIIPWDVDLSFGHQWNVSEGYFDDDLVYADGFYANHGGNHLVNRLRAIPKFDEMYKRRLRSLLDEFYGPSGQPIADSLMAERFDALIGQIGADAAMDRERWGFPPAFSEETPSQAVARVKQEFLAPRKQHLNNLSGVPPTPIGDVEIRFGAIEFNPASGDQGEEYIALVNDGSAAVDMSGWSVSGAVDHMFAGGTVIPAGSTYYLVADVGEFQERATGPRGGQRLLIQGNYDGELNNVGGELSLKNSADVRIANTTFGTRPPPGDYNSDGTVDSDDYGVWTGTFQSTLDLRADGNRNDVVDAADYVVWRKQLIERSATTSNGGPGLSDIATVAGVAVPDADQLQRGATAVLLDDLEELATAHRRQSLPSHHLMEREPASQVARRGLAEELHAVFRRWRDSHEAMLSDQTREKSADTSKFDDAAMALDCAFAEVTDWRCAVTTYHAYHAK